MSVPHPAADGRAGRAVVSETRTRVAYLSEARADLLLRGAGRRRPLVLVSDEVTRLSYPLREALQDAGSAWVVRATDGTLRDGFTGRRLERFADAVDGRPMRPDDDVAVRYLRPAPAEAVQLFVSQSVRHTATATTVLGATADLFAEELTGAPLAGWGTHEPAVVAWDRTRLTELARRRMPNDTTLVVTGRGLVGTIRVSRAAHGLEETTQLAVAVGAPGSDTAREALDRVPGIVRALAAHHMPLFGLVLARAGRADLTFPSLLEAPPVAVGMLVGPPGVRELGLDVTDLADRLDARVVGRPRIPGLYFPLGGFGDTGWARLHAVVDALGRDRVGAIIGTAGTWLEASGGR